jgi:hypothetical protein
VAERDAEAVANEADDGAGDEAGSDEPAPATDGDEQTEEAGTAVEA